jgi:hypothetical protein
MGADNQAATKHNPSEEFKVNIFLLINETVVMNLRMINHLAPGTHTSINKSGQTKKSL